MSDYRFEIVERTEAHTGNDLPCLHVMIDSNSNREIAATHIPLDDILEAIARYLRHSHVDVIRARTEVSHDLRP